jgi:hypothetical protein
VALALAPARGAGARSVHGRETSRREDLAADRLRPVVRCDTQDPHSRRRDEDMPVELGEDGAEQAHTSGLQSNGLELNGIEPNGVQPNGVQPNGIEPNGIEPNGVQPNGMQPNGMQPNGMQPNGIEPNGPRVAGTRDDAEIHGPGANGVDPNGSAATAVRGHGLRALRINGIRLEAGPAGLRIDAIVVNGMKLEASGGLVIEEVEVEAPKPITATSLAPAPDFGAVTVSSIELPDGRRFDH